MEIPRSVLNELIDATAEQLDDPSSLDPATAEIIEIMDDSLRDKLRYCKVRDAELVAESQRVLAQPPSDNNEEAEETFRKLDETRREGKEREDQIPRDIDEEDFRTEIATIQDETDDKCWSILRNGDPQVYLDHIEMELETLQDEQRKLIIKAHKKTAGCRY